MQLNLVFSNYQKILKNNKIIVMRILFTYIICIKYNTFTIGININIITEFGMTKIRISYFFYSRFIFILI